jgi:hypothetical protein
MPRKLLEQLLSPTRTFKRTREDHSMKKKKRAVKSTKLKKVALPLSALQVSKILLERRSQGP